jgi:Kef-type K+ transport system membrane component KefB
LAFVMTSDVVVLVLVAAGLMTARGLLEPGASLSLEAFRELGHEILGSVAIGTTLGVLLIIYLRLIGPQLVVVLVALGFGATEVLHYLRFEPLLTFLVAGFVVQNLSQQGDKLLHAVDEMGAVVFVIFFAFAGADLEIPLLRELWPLALVLAAARTAVTWVAARLSSAIAKDVPTLKKWGWAPLIAQAGLTQGFGTVVERAFPTFGAPFRALVFANVALNAMIGPILFKLALDRSGESQGPAPALDEAEETQPS